MAHAWIGLHPNFCSAGSVEFAIIQRGKNMSQRRASHSSAPMIRSHGVQFLSDARTVIMTISVMDTAGATVE